MTTDYHSKPVLAGRVDADVKTWAQDEAKRRGLPFGDFLENLLVAERDRMVHHVANHPPVFLSAGDEQPQQAGKNCTHRNMRIGKGVCPDCKEWIVKS